jgi:hypothetical protein
MGDPREGHFSEAIIPIQNLWAAGTKMIQVKGWYSPSRREILVRNGLWYPVHQYLGRALPTHTTEPPQALGSTAGSRNAMELAPALWLIAGDAEMARACWQPQGYDRPFFVLATAFLSARYERAVLAHRAGDSQAALHDLRDLARIRQAFHDQYETYLSREERKRWDDSFPPPPETVSIYFRFLEPVDDLIAESERRLARRDRARPNPYTLAAAPPRIMALIDHLDEAIAHQMGQPAPLRLRNSFRVQDLMAEGEAAMEPLLQSAKSDRRFTLAVAFPRDFGHSRTVLPVRAAIVEAIRGILGTDELPSHEGRVDFNATRDFWLSTQGMSHAERWFAVLQDDQAGARRWVEAMKRLMDPQTIDRTRVTWDERNDRTQDPDAKRWAEEVRPRKNPSLADLMTRRIEDMTPPASNAQSLEMALLLYEWDAPAALASLQRQSRRLMQAGASSSRFNLGWDGDLLADAVTARAKQGDRTALSEWCHWLLSLEKLESVRGPSPVRLLTDFADDPIMKDSAEAVFAHPAGVLSVSRLAEKGAHVVGAFVNSPLTSLKPFQQSLRHGLLDRQVIGSVQRSRTESLTVRCGGLTSGITLLPAALAQPELIGVGDTIPLRVADTVAHALSGFPGAPRFHMGWTIAQKDAILSEFQPFLELTILRILARPPPYTRGR